MQTYCITTKILLYSTLRLQPINVEMRISMKQILRWLITFPVLLLSGFLLIANSHTVFISLDPFNSVDPALSLELSLYIVILVSISIGLLLGGIIVWLGQHKYRKASRIHKKDANKWHSEADKLRENAEEKAYRSVEVKKTSN